MWATLITVGLLTAFFFILAPSEASREVRIIWYSALCATHAGITIEGWLVKLLDSLRDRVEEWRTQPENLRGRRGH
jgi:hypothetical protein